MIFEVFSTPYFQPKSHASVRRARPSTPSWDAGPTCTPSKHRVPVATKTTLASHKVKQPLKSLKSSKTILGERHSAKYSMGDRTKYRKCDAYPSPNSYSLPQLIGPKIPSKQASNAYSMTSRRQIGSFDQDLARTPGSARFDP